MEMEYFNILLSFVVLISSNTLSYCKDNVQDSTELLLAFMIHRHGDRTPVNKGIAFSRNPEKVLSLTKKYGFGQLTDRGKRRSYELGKSIRRRYGSYISQQYNRSEIYIRSTDSTRTKMTILTALSAIYPVDKNNWSNDINWTPVPYTTVPAIYDPILAIVNCPVFLKAHINAFKQAVPELTAKYRTLLNNMSEIIGSNITDCPLMTFVLYDVFVSQINLGVPLGEKLEAMLPEIADAAAVSMGIVFGDEKYINLLAGILLKEFFDAADKMISGEDVQKIHIYSAHDVNVFALATVTRVKPKIGVPKYASLYALELRKVIKTGEYIVVPVYLEEPGVDEVYLQVDGCRDLCDLKTFRNLTANFVLNISEWRTLCKFREDYAFDISSID